MVEKQNRPTFRDLQENLQTIHCQTMPPRCMYIVISYKVYANILHLTPFKLPALTPEIYLLAWSKEMEW